MESEVGSEYFDPMLLSRLHSIPLPVDLHLGVVHDTIVEGMEPVVFE
jgi:hypothetical protein